jgi:hypothetical protein
MAWARTLAGATARTGFDAHSIAEDMPPNSLTVC